MYVSEFVVGVVAVLAIETVMVFGYSFYRVWKDNKEKRDGERKK